MEPVQNLKNLSAAQSLKTGKRFAFLGMMINVVLSVIKILAGWLGNSYALIADGIESATDIVSSFIMWNGLKLAGKPADQDHPYGHGKAEPIAALIGSVALIAAAAGLTHQSLEALRTRPHTPSSWTLLILLVVIVTKEVLFRQVAEAGHKAKSTAMKADAWHHRSDAITSVSALIGISIALIGGRGFEQADCWAALFACVIIGLNGFMLFIPAVNEIMDAAPPKEIIDEIRQVAIVVKGVIDIDQCKVRKMGLEFYVDLHVGVNGTISVIEGHHISHRVKDAIRESNPAITDVLVHIEPVIGNARGMATVARMGGEGLEPPTGSV